RPHGRRQARAARRLRGARRRQAGGPGYERHVFAHVRKAARHGLCAAGARRRGHEAHGRYPRQAGTGRGRSAAVLQTQLISHSRIGQHSLSLKEAAVKPEQLLFSKSHEWVHVEGAAGAKVATVGITAFAVELLTDLVYLELPKVGKKAKAGE